MPCCRELLSQEGGRRAGLRAWESLTCPEKRCHLHTLLVQEAGPSSKRETSFVSNSPSPFSLGLCIKDQVALVVVLRAFPLADFYLYFLTAGGKCSRKLCENFFCG